MAAWRAVGGQPCLARRTFFFLAYALGCIDSIAFVIFSADGTYNTEDTLPGSNFNVRQGRAEPRRHLLRACRS